MKKIYIAGPDVFEADAKERGERYKKLCMQYGYEGLFPLDNEIALCGSPNEVACTIFKANVEMIDACDIVIANLNPFRGKESDSGTVWECGYAYAKGKEVYGYMQNVRNYKERFSEEETQKEGDRLLDADGKIIEDFGYPLNLMIACSVQKIVAGSFEDALKELHAQSSRS